MAVDVSVGLQGEESRRVSRAIFRVSHLGVVLHVARVKRDGFQVELAVEVDGANDVPAGARLVGQPGRSAEFSGGVPGKKQHA